MNPLIHRLPTLLALLMLGACASAPRPPVEDISHPALNVTTSAYLGERLLMQAQGSYVPVIQVQSLRGKFVRINEETFCQRTPGSKEFFSFNGAAVTYLNFIGGWRGDSNKIVFDSAKGKVCLKDMWSGCFAPPKVKFSYQATGVCSQPNSLQRIVEYNGKSGETLNFTYREFRGQRMASQFTQNFTMDLNEGRIINYRGARLEVATATNQEITYRVLQNFSTL